MSRDAEFVRSENCNIWICHWNVSKLIVSMKHAWCVYYIYIYIWVYVLIIMLVTNKSISHVKNLNPNNHLQVGRPSNHISNSECPLLFWKGSCVQTQMLPFWRSYFTIDCERIFRKKWAFAWSVRRICTETVPPQGMVQSIMGVFEFYPPWNWRSWTLGTLILEISFQVTMPQTTHLSGLWWRLGP